MGPYGSSSMFADWYSGHVRSASLQDARDRLTLDALQFARRLQNENELPPTPPSLFSPNSTAIPYNVSFTAAAFQAQNANRPYTTLTVVGPYAPQYFAGLAIVPIVILFFLVVWLFVMVVLACLQGKLEAMQRGKKTGGRWKMWGCVAALMLGSLVAWICAFGYSVAASSGDWSLSNNLDEINYQLQSVAGYLGNSTRHVAAAQSNVASMNLYCNTSNPVIGNVTRVLAGLVNTTADGVNAAVSAATPFVTKASENISSTSDMLGYWLRVRTIIFSAISGVQALLVLLCFIVACFGALGKVREIKWFNRGCCCRGCCTPILTIAITMTILMIVLAAVLHAVALVMSDVCAPDVNTNVNRVIGEVIKYPTFADYPGYNLTEMCAQLQVRNNTSADIVRPLALSALCFYQTCDPRVNFFDDVLKAVDSLFDVTMAVRNESLTLIEELKAVAPDGECIGSMSNLIPNYVHILVDAFWALSYLSCSNVNRIYASTLYDNVCYAQVGVVVGTFGSWMAGSVLLMMALIVWLTFRKYLHDVGDEPFTDIPPGKSDPPQTHEGADEIVDVPSAVRPPVNSLPLAETLRPPTSGPNSFEAIALA